MNVAVEPDAAPVLAAGIGDEDATLATTGAADATAANAPLVLLLKLGGWDTHAVDPKSDTKTDAGGDVGTQKIVEMRERASAGLRPKDGSGCH